MKCRYCQQTFTYKLSLEELFSLSLSIPKQLCPKCQALFTRLYKKNSCKKCMKNSTKSICSDCMIWKKEYPHYNFRHQALFQYNDSMHEWFSLYKFKGHHQLAYCFATDLRKYFRQYKKYIFVPIPLSEERQIQRGFNQVITLLEAAHLPYFDCLKKYPNHDIAQSSKNKKERLQMKQPFYIEEQNIPKLKNKNILLVDDIYTTGRTLFHASDCFLNLTIKNIQTFSLAR